MHETASHTHRQYLPNEIADTLLRNENRRAGRCAVWRERMNTARTFRAGYEQAAARACVASMDFDAHGSDL